MDISRRSFIQRQTFTMHGLMTFLTVTLLLVGFSQSYAQWTSDSTSSTAVCTAAGSQSTPVTCSDSAGGVYVAWLDYRNSNMDIYAQRLTDYGAPSWQANGIPVCTTTGIKRLLAITADGAGGMLLAWADERVSQSDPNIYAQRIDSTGNLKWTATGVAVCTATTNQSYPDIVSDGHGGAFITWLDDRIAGQTDVYAQHLDASGSAKWATNGIQVRAKVGAMPQPQIVSDEKGGVIIAWCQADQSYSNKGVYAQRIDSTGVLQWGPDGIAARLTNAYYPTPEIIADGVGGAILTWAEPINSQYNDIAAQRIDGAGNILWAANGVSVCTATGPQSSPVLVSDLDCGAIITWTDTRAGGSNGDIYAQHVDSSGIAVWKANGVGICTVQGYQAAPKVISDGLGGAVICWRDQRSGSFYRTYAQHVNRVGSPIWRPDGIAVSYKNADNNTVEMVPDQFGGAIIVWDYQTTPDIYAQHVTTAGILGNPTLQAPAQDLPQADALGLSITPRFSWSPVVGATSYQLQVATDFSFSGSVVFDDSTITDTSATVGELLHNSTYFWRVRARNSSLIGSYSSDRRFLTVVQEPSTPLLVLPISSALASADSIILRWQRSSPSVLKYFVEHSNDSLFATAAMDSTTDTTFVLRELVNNQTYFWRVYAMNAGGWSSSSEVRKISVIIAGVRVQENLPMDFALGQNYPNPFNPTTTIEYSLPQRSQIAMTIFNTLGQDVATLVNGDVEAGYHSVQFDGSKLASGVYFYRLQAGSFVQTKRLLLLR